MRVARLFFSFPFSPFSLFFLPAEATHSHSIPLLFRCGKRQKKETGQVWGTTFNRDKPQQKTTARLSHLLIISCLSVWCCYSCSLLVIVKIHMGMRNVIITVKLSLINPVPICGFFFGAVSLNRHFHSFFDLLKCPPMRRHTKHLALSTKTK